MDQKKLKVVLINHFSNAQVRERLSLDSRKLYALMRKLLQMPAKNTAYGDVAPWTSDIITHLKKRDDIELHVISGHTGMKQMYQEFDLEGVHYHFVKVDYTTLLKRLIPSDNLWRKLNPLKPLVHRIVSKISPDIVNLIGAENAYISGTVLGISDYPVFVLCQTIYNNPDRIKYGTVDRKNASTERLIFNSFKYFGVYSEMHYHLLENLSPKAYIFPFKWPAVRFPTVTEVKNKRFDFVNFAVAMSFNKGYHDSIKALAIVKRKYPEVSLNLVGAADTNIRKELENLIEDLSLKDNIFLTGYFERQEDMFQHILYSRYAVLPCKMDNIAGTMVQAMHYGLPLIVYKTPGTPSLNKERENVLIAEHSNVEELSEKMIYLLDHPEEAERLRKNARDFSLKQNADDSAVHDLVDKYRLIKEHYTHHTPIPQEALFKHKL